MIHIYHPNKAVKGFACSFWYSARNKSLFATILKQSGWDDANQNGIFKANINDPDKKVSIKLSWVEAAAILDCIERNREFTTFHDAEPPKSISFVPWQSKAFRDGEGKAVPASQKGFSFSVTINNKEDSTKKNSFYIGLTFAEARLIREFIIHSMHRNFDTIQSNQPSSVAALEAVKSEEPTNNSQPEQSNNVDPFTGM
jgi:hypothetical protein